MKKELTLGREAEQWAAGVDTSPGCYVESATAVGFVRGLLRELEEAEAELAPLRELANVASWTVQNNAASDRLIEALGDLFMWRLARGMAKARAAEKMS